MGEWLTDLTLHCATEENHHRECADQEWSKKAKWEGYRFRKKNAVHFESSSSSCLVYSS